MLEFFRCPAYCGVVIPDAPNNGLYHCINCKSKWDWLALFDGNDNPDETISFDFPECDGDIPLMPKKLLTPVQGADEIALIAYVCNLSGVSPDGYLLVHDVMINGWRHVWIAQKANGAITDDSLEVWFTPGSASRAPVLDTTFAP